MAEPGVAGREGLEVGDEAVEPVEPDEVIGQEECQLVQGAGRREDLALFPAQRLS